MKNSFVKVHGILRRLPDRDCRTGLHDLYTHSNSPSYCNFFESNHSAAGAPRPYPHWGCLFISCGAAHGCLWNGWLMKAAWN